MTSVVPSDEQREDETSTTTDPVYRDFSRVTSTEDTAIQTLIAIGQRRTSTTPTGITGTSSDRNFPVRLHYILSELEADGLSHIVAWQPHGRCFIVHKQQEFVDLVLRRWFRQSQLASFQRQLNIYCFNRITSGPDKHAYYHECFLRGKLFLAQSIKRTKVKGKGPRRPGSKTEPNFYAMPFLPPSKPNVGYKRDPTPPELHQRFISQGMHSNNTSAWLSYEHPTMNGLRLGSLASDGNRTMNCFGTSHPSLLHHWTMPFAQVHATSRFDAPGAASNYVLPQQAAHQLHAAMQQPLLQNAFGKPPNRQEEYGPSLADDALAMSQQLSQRRRPRERQVMPPNELARAIMMESIAARCRAAQSVSTAAGIRDLYPGTVDAHHRHSQHQPILTRLRNEEIQRFLEDTMKNTSHHH